TAKRQNQRSSFIVRICIGSLMKRRSSIASSSAFTESFANVASRNQVGRSWATGLNSRIGSTPMMYIHQFRGWLNKSAQSKTESGNQNGDGHAWLKDIPKRYAK